jgi:hypothetical protein
MCLVYPETSIQKPVSSIASSQTMLYSLFQLVDFRRSFVREYQ